MANVIVNRVQEFLKKHPPFSFLNQDDLASVASQIEIQYHEKGEILFEKGDAPEAYFFILKEGQIELKDGEETKDFCDEGDVFGVLALLGKRPYILTAAVLENSLVYCIPVNAFEEILQRNSKVALFFAAGFASGQVVIRQDLSAGQKARGIFKKDNNDHSLLIFSDQSEIRFSENVVCIAPESSIQQAAEKMAEKEVSSVVIINSDKYPVGIITDKDLRTKVVAKAISLDLPVKQIMSSPVITKKRDSSFSDLYLSMIKNRLHHLILTEDGSAESPVCGILSDHDVLLSMGNSPAVLINALLNTTDLTEMRAIRDRAETMLRYYLENEVSMDFVASVMTEINDVIIQQATKIARSKLAPEFPEMQGIKFAFISLGSEGREEQLLRTDQDNALIYEDLPASVQVKAANYFHLMGSEIVEVLLACGFASCPGEIMASNPKWVQPLSKWKEYFSEWILSPTQESLMQASIFFDFRKITGSSSLTDELSAHIYEEIQSKKAFLSFMAQNALKNPPPLGFFKDFMVEKSGEHRDQFDIKARAMMPLADLARLLVLSHGITGINNTFKRFEKLGQLEPNYESLFNQAGKAYEILMRMRALEGLQNDNSGRFISPEHMGKLQRQLLKNTFSPLAELQDIVEVRFQLAYFRK
ncbi:MAG TPA: histidine kinase [Algoriphagus sp.]|jgi:CBS domain-containing protein|uniref:DUF294 nucleotidyltransferase-like domain-containing protein n=3 Tax=Algoriphagus TaxID=246875 RepID=UPI000C4602A1|nr:MULTISPECIES: DUF294 nucleotidyltransferase-like domain-containing protein [unclassified Algoriphagus]MAL15407.1 histidine kinase [Algoriphagus sp.]QYH40355.1 CBS domain-containing protein [Algoriphagus sp. NBT04N3]HAH37607.1 histidine kinase [Algoriphagus sp.]HCB44991.1 histidine kinase [Algoriphagus sp.]HCD88503.1 histidine kinase [Algoriphagus sp.]|tara:strand:+ start:3278 stop:5212 length:1935 start_codon:yes stop_codon:yes gene_type:complete